MKLAFLKQTAIIVNTQTKLHDVTFELLHASLQQADPQCPVKR